MTSESRHTRAHLDWPLILMVYAMCIFGIVAICVASYTTSSTPDTSLLNHIVESSYTMKQCLFLLVSFLVIGVVTVFPYDWLRRYNNLIYWLTLVLLIVVTAVNRAQGVKAWLDVIWGYTIQPSEFAKLALILALAKHFSAFDQPMSSFRDFFYTMGLVGIPCAVIMIQGETGSMMVIVFLFAVMMFFSNVNWKVLLGLALFAIFLILSIYGIMVATGSDDYRLARIAAFINPDMYSSSDAYQMRQSQKAIGSGGFSGNGMFLDDAISTLNYVPADWTDFIFSTIGETWGFVGCAGVVIMYILILLRMVYLAYYTRDRFGRLIICGVTGMLLFHVLENIAMTMGMMPITGIPLPFLSYGGSNMVTNMGGIGLVLNVTRNRTLSAPIATPQTLHNPYRFSRDFNRKPFFR